MSDFQLIEALQRPEAFGHPVGRFEVLQTHISWVLLTGPFAYKLKKPVDLGFVDFSTLEKRRFYCEEELRLNRRLAPGLYVGVAGVYGSQESPRVEDVAAAEGEACEYAVKMKQFDQSQLAAAALERGELEPRHWDGLADDLAKFHADSPSVELAGSLGTGETAAKYMRTNFEALGNANGGADFAGQVEELRAWTEDQLVALGDVLAERRRAGLVRECHGDLHLGNLVFLNDKLAPFDCIDFNEELRWLDVQSEIAFLVMDLQDRGEPGTAFRVLNRYLEATGDYAGLAVLPVFQTYRAMVRAKVASIRGHQGDVRQAELAGLQRELQTYVHLARGYTRPARPSLVLMHGVSGSGKSTWSGRLVEQAGAVRVRSDVERKRLHGDFPSLGPLATRGDEELYGGEATARTYERLLDLAKGILAAGYTAVVDATFLRRDQRRPFEDWADQQGVPWLIVDCVAPDEELRARVRRRQEAGGDPSDASLEILEQQRKQQEPLTDEERAAAVTLEGGAGGAIGLTGAITGDHVKRSAGGTENGESAWEKLVARLRSRKDAAS